MPVHDLIDIAMVMIVGLIVSAHYFAELAMLHGLLLATAPLWYCLTALPYVRRIRWWAKASVGVVLVAVPLAIVAMDAQRTFFERSAPAGIGDPHEPTADDYMNFGN